jgi:hypothetical protein
MELRVFSVDELLKARRAMQITTASEAAKKAWETRKFGGSHKTELPAKGQVLKPREEVKHEIPEASKKDYSKFRNNLREYFTTQNEYRDLQGQIEGKKAELEDQMKVIRPYLAKMQNLETKENKFRAKFEDDGFKYEFLQFTLTRTPYKELYTEAFSKLNDQAKAEMTAIQKKLGQTYAQEKFERESLTKAESIVDHLKKLCAIKEKGLELLKKIATPGLRKAIMLKLAPEVFEEYKRGNRLVVVSPMVGEADLEKDEEDDMEIITLDEALMEKSKEKQPFQIDGKINKELLAQIEEDKGKIKAHYRGDFVVKEPGVPDHKGRPSAIIEMTSGKWKGGTFEIFLNGIE